MTRHNKKTDTMSFESPPPVLQGLWPMACWEMMQMQRVNFRAHLLADQRGPCVKFPPGKWPGAVVGLMGTAMILAAVDSATALLAPVPAMDLDTEVDVDLSPFLIRYKSGRVRRLISSPRVGAGSDAATGVTSRDVAIDAAAGLAARLHVPSDILGKPEEKLPLLVYFHGGAFALHSAFSAAHSRFVNALVSAARVLAVSVEYRLAPEHPLPAAYDDAWAALRWAVASCCPEREPWLSAHGDVARLLVAGDSAGANIAHHVTLRAGGGGLPGGARIDGIALLHPYFRGRELVPSEGTDPMSMARERSERLWAFVCAGRYGFDHPFLNPLAMPAAGWAALGCRRALVAVAERDTMSDRDRRYVEALRRSAWAGEEAVLYETHGEGHVFFLRKSDGRDDKAKEEMIAAVASFMASSTAKARLGTSARSLRCDAKL